MTTNRVILISYPSGGFGNFLFHVLTVFARNMYKVPNNEFEFSSVGDSHKTIKYTKVYFHDPDTYNLIIPDPSKTTLVLCDNGLGNDSYDKIRTFFPTETIIRISITPPVRPVIWQTCIIKALKHDLIEENKPNVDTNWTDANEDYAVRENFTLMYKGWHWKWEPVTCQNVINIELEKLIDDPVGTIVKLIQSIGDEVLQYDELVSTCNQWSEVNKQYFKIYYDWIRIEHALDNNVSESIDDITDLHSQGYINYCIEHKFNVTIPVYDYLDWFKTTDDIKEMIQCLK